ncbi:MAG TPA: tetratricopeptide repeat protein [Chitinophagaceae bacterium]|jgi:Tfp pilus assembly protein PilF|nr:tetratricopeptide repeat protein [Chitinophagaceae bacterium]
MDRVARIIELLKATPQDSFLQHALALELIKAGNDAEARKMFETILAQDPNYTGSYYHLAKLLERIGQKDAAIEWYEKGLAVTKAVGDNHSYIELKAAYEDLVF